MTTRDELLALQKRMCSEAYAKMVKKSSDYSEDGDALANHRSCEGVPGRKLTVDDSIICRIMDKVCRLSNAASGKELKVTDEKIEDTTHDLINFAVILHAAIMETRSARDSD